MTPDELATYRAGVAAESARNADIIAADAARMLETQRAELEAKRTAMLAKGWKPWRITVIDMFDTQRKPHTLLYFHRTAAQAKRLCESCGYETQSIAPWEGPLPDPITGRIR